MSRTAHWNVRSRVRRLPQFLPLLVGHEARVGGYGLDTTYGSALANGVHDTEQRCPERLELGLSRHASKACHLKSIVGDAFFGANLAAQNFEPMLVEQTRDGVEQPGKVARLKRDLPVLRG